MPDAPSLEQLPTPALIVDVDRVERNLRLAQEAADRAGVALRPHTKTHKIPRFARRQLELGAKGVSVAKLGEAEVMADAGLDDLFVANTVMGTDKARRAAALAGRVRLALGVDHLEQARALSRAATDAGVTLDLMIEVDSGSRRGGVAPGDAAALARALRDMDGLQTRGIYTYEGYTYSAASPEALRERHREAQRLMIDVADELEEVVPRAWISMGSTPSLLAEPEYDPRIDEIRPGTYIFLDAAQAELAGGIERCAAHVLATVVSRQVGRAIVDAGSKTLTSDQRSDGVCRTVGFGLLVDQGLPVARVSEEHGVIEGPGVEELEVGQKVRILPNHICPVVNLSDEIVLVGGEKGLEHVEVAGRGRRT